MSQLIKHKLRTICSVLMIFGSAVAIFSGNAAAAATCYTYDTNTYTKVDCSQLQNDQPSFKPNNSGTHCYGERQGPQGVQISEVNCAAAQSNGSNLSGINFTPSTSGTTTPTNNSAKNIPALCGFNSGPANSKDANCQPDNTNTSSCGTNSSGNPVKTAIDFGCKASSNPIMSLLYAVIRFLAAGVGIVLIASVVVAGIQYSSARGDPNATTAAIKRLQSTGAALLIYVFAYAILNYLIPGGFLHP